jgi:hypothetical protein
MQIAEESMKLLREASLTNEEMSYLKSYSDMVVEVGDMKIELEKFKGDTDSELFKSKSKRVDNLQECLLNFMQCYFAMVTYKERAFTHKHEMLQKEMEMLNFINKSLDNGIDS